MMLQRAPVQLLPAEPLDGMTTPGGTVRAGILRRDASDGNPCGVSFWPAGAHSIREVDLTRRLLAARLGARSADFRLLRQEHGTRIRVHAGSGAAASPEPIRTGDGQVTGVAGPVLVVNTADCCPVILMDPAGPVVGIAHAGWRGTAEGIVERLLEVMVEQGASRSSCRAWIGPCADGEHYEIGAEVAERFGNWPDALRPHPGAPGRWLLDLALVNYAQLGTAGLAPGHIATSAAGTIADRRFHSHRRDRFRAGRMAAFITLRA